MKKRKNDENWNPTSLSPQKTVRKTMKVTQQVVTSKFRSHNKSSTLGGGKITQRLHHLNSRKIKKIKKFQRVITKNNSKVNFDSNSSRTEARANIFDDTSILDTSKESDLFVNSNVKFRLNFDVAQSARQKREIPEITPRKQPLTGKKIRLKNFSDLTTPQRAQKHSWKKFTQSSRKKAKKVKNSLHHFSARYYTQKKSRKSKIKSKTHSRIVNKSASINVETSVNRLKMIKNGLRNLLKLEFFRLEGSFQSLKNHTPIMKKNILGSQTNSYINFENELNLQMRNDQSLDFFDCEHFKKKANEPTIQFSVGASQKSSKNITELSN